MATYGATYSVTIPAVDDAIASGYTAVRFYRAPAEEGPYTLAGSKTLVSGQTLYELDDPNATRTTWWQWALYGTGPGESERSTPQPVAYLSYTRRDIREEVGRRLGIMVLATVSSGTASSFASPDLVDPDASSLHWANGWVYGISGANENAQRRIRSGSNGYNPATGQLTLASPLASAPVSGDMFEVWAPAPSRIATPELINNAINTAAPFMWVTDVTYIETDDLETELPTLAFSGGIHTVEAQAGQAWVPLPKYEVVERMGVSILRLPFKVRKPLRVIYNRHMDALQSDDDTWEVPLRWAAAEAAARYLASLVVPMGNKELISDIAASLQVASAEAAQYRRIYSARRPPVREVAPWM